MPKTKLSDIKQNYYNTSCNVLVIKNTQYNYNERLTNKKVKNSDTFTYVKKY